eukprot:COSAG06_NODE_4083_length_4593_cov_1.575211_5_plen_440_part_00
MSVYPRNMSTFLNKLSGYNKQNVKLNVLGSSNANHGDVIQVDLPTNSIVDLSSLAWSFAVTYGAPGANGNIDLPINAESVISRLAVEVNGQTLVNITNYNVLFHALLYMTSTEDYQQQRLVAQANTTDGTAPGTSETVAANAAAVTREHVIDSWVGFIGSAKPNFLDTSLLGNVRISITLAGADIITGNAANVDRAYSIADQHFSIDTVMIGDGLYDAMVNQMLASGAPIEVPFKNYFSFTSQNAGMDQSTSFAVASQSIDRLWAIARPQNYNDPAQQKVGTAPAHGIVTQNPRPFNFQSCNGSEFQFKANSTPYPNWTSTKAQDWFQHTKLAVGDQGNMLAGSFPTALSHYENAFFVYACQLEHRSDNDERFMSGIDTRGSAAQCFFTSRQSIINPDPMNGGGGAINRTALVPNQVVVFAECTSSLRIMANKVLEIVQ